MTIYYTVIRTANRRFEHGGTRIHAQKPRVGHPFSHTASERIEMVALPHAAARTSPASGRPPHGRFLGLGAAKLVPEGNY
jgi:hypothetical protein